MERENLNVRVIQGEHGAPDIKWAVPTMEFSKKEHVPAVFGTFLYPYRGSDPDFSSATLGIAQPRIWGKVVHTSQEDAEILIAKDGKAVPLSFRSKLKAANIDATAAGLILRRPRGEESVLIGGWDFTTYRDNDLQLKTSARSALVIAQQADGRVILNAGTTPVSITLERPIAVSIVLAPSSAVRVDVTGTHVVQDLSLFRMPEEAVVPTGAVQGLGTNGDRSAEILPSSPDGKDDR